MSDADMRRHREEASLLCSKLEATIGEAYSYLTDVENAAKETLEKLDAVIAENERLREALEPFAAMADEYGEDDTDAQSAFLHEGAVTIGHLRRARDAVRKG